MVHMNRQYHTIGTSENKVKTLGSQGLKSLLMCFNGCA